MCCQFSALLVGVAEEDHYIEAIRVLTSVCSCICAPLLWDGRLPTGLRGLPGSSNLPTRMDCPATRLGVLPTLQLCGSNIDAKATTEGPLGAFVAGWIVKQFHELKVLGMVEHQAVDESIARAIKTGSKETKSDRVGHLPIFVHRAIHVATNEIAHRVQALHGCPSASPGGHCRRDRIRPASGIGWTRLGSGRGRNRLGSGRGWRRARWARWGKGNGAVCIVCWVCARGRICKIVREESDEVAGWPKEEVNGPIAPDWTRCRLPGITSRHFIKQVSCASR